MRLTLRNTILHVALRMHFMDLATGSVGSFIAAQVVRPFFRSSAEIFA
jgi:hypothetical protein